MKTNRLSLILLVLLLASPLAGCASEYAPAAGNTPEPQAMEQQPDPQQTVDAMGELGSPIEEIPGTQETQPPTFAAPTSAPSPDTPDGVALLFFEAYTEASRNGRPSLQDPKFDARQYLSEAYLQQVAEIQAGFEGFGFDPVLQAQDVPPAPVEVKDAQVDGDHAAVTLQFGRGAIPKPWERVVSLERIGGQWQIVPDRVDGGDKSPIETVQAFYDWYLEYAGSGEAFRSPLSDRAYREAPHLAGEMIQEVDRTAEAGDFQYDPFLCAQDLPAEITPVASFYNDARPVVVMGSSFPGHYVIADLARANFNSWVIRDISCGSEAEGLVKAFYTWMLDYMTQEGEMRNPWVEGAHRESDFLSRSFIEELDQLVESGEPLMADPLMLAQDLPQAFNTEPCPERDCALANMQFGDYLIRQLRVDLVEEDGRLRISAVSHPQGPESPTPAQGAAGVDHWIPYVDEQYGYAVRFPAGWEVKASRVSDLHTPDDYPVMRWVRFTPPVETGDIVPLQLEVIVGDAETVSSAYPLTDLSEEMEVNGYPVKVYFSGPGLIYYVFRQPSAENVWVVVTDAVTHFPGREAQAAELGDVFEAMLSTIAFRE